MSVEEAAARRREEIERMAAWENKIGKGGKVMDLNLGGDVAPLKAGGTLPLPHDISYFLTTFFVYMK